VRQSHVFVVLAILVSGCSAEGGRAASPSIEASAATTASPRPSASPSASAEPDWAALPSLEDAVIASEPIAGPLPGRYTSATAGALWIPNGNADGRAAVARIDDETLEVVTTIELGGSEHGSPPDAEATAPGANGVWVTLAYQDAVALVDPTANAESRRIAVEGDPYSLVENGDSLWIADFGGAVVRVDIATGEEQLRVTSINGPTQLAVAFGGVWVADHESGNIVRLDPETGDTVATIPVGGRPGVAIGFDGVWVRSDDEGTVTRIDPSTNEAVATIAMPTFATDIEVAGDSVWVVGGPQRGSCEGTGYLVRIDPESNAVDGHMPMDCPTMLATDVTGLWAGNSMEGETDFSIISLDPEQGA
jgi:outer membrane protein assembly factor BamB